jgi:Zn-dependent protease
MLHAFCLWLTADSLHSYQGGSQLDLTPAALITRAIVFLVALDVHEFAHAYVAYLMGDSTAAEQGRMTLNPLININWMGYLTGILIGIGILGSAPVNPYRMRNRRLGMFLAVGAGPIANLITAALFAIPFRLFPSLLAGAFVSSTLIPTGEFVLFNMVWLNIILFVFNLLPLHPLDGWTVVLAAIPPEWAIWWERNRQNSMYVFYGLIALLFIGPNLAAMSPALAPLNVTSWLIFTPVNTLMRLLIGQ